MHLGNLLTPMLKSISKGSGEAVFSLSIFNVTIWVQYLITSFIYLLGMNYIDAAMRKQDSNLGRFSSGRVMLLLHRSSVMFYTGSQFLFASSLRSVCCCTSRFMGLRLGTCASIVRRRIHPLRG